MSTGRKLWKIIVAALLLVPLFAGALGANAVELEDVTVSIHKRVFDEDAEDDKYPSPPIADIENTGNEMPTFPGEPLEGATFTVYNVTDFYHNAISGSNQTAAIAAVLGADFDDFDVVTSDVTDEQGLAEFGLATKHNGKDAVYLFVETGTPATPNIVKKAAPFVLAMPIYALDNDGNYVGEQLENIHVYPKNITASDSKELENASTFPTVIVNGEVHPNVQIGDTLTYKLTVNIPIDVADLATFKVIDRPAAGMVVATSDDGFSIDNAVASAAAQKTISPDRTELDVAFNGEDLASIAGQVITIKYNMVLTDDVALDTVIENNASVISFDNEMEVHENEIPTPPGVVTNGKKLIKSDAHTGAGLPGSAFGFYRVKDGNTQWAIFTKDGNKYIHNGWTTTAPTYDPEDETVSSSVIVTPGNGQFDLAGFQSGPYFLQELYAPNGYVLLTDPIPVNIAQGDTLPQAVRQDVPNVPKGLLPSTGGSGIYAFLIIGAMMMGGAYIWFKRSKEQAEV